MERQADIPERARGDKVLLIFGIRDKTDRDGLLHIHGDFGTVKDPDFIIGELRKRYVELQFRLLGLFVGITERASVLLERQSLTMAPEKLTRQRMMQVLVVGDQ